MSSGEGEASGQEVRLPTESRCRYQGAAGEAVYQWELAGARLHPNVVEDGCDDRREGLSGTSAPHQWLAAWDDRLDRFDPRSPTVGEVWDDTDPVARA